MNDRMKESLSALCDGECDELEVRRVLNQVGQEPELREQWHNYHLMGAVMRGEAASAVDLSKGVMQALDGLPMDDIVAAPERAGASPTPATVTTAELSTTSGWMPQWLVSGAVAASVTIAVLVGARLINETQTTQPLMLAQDTQTTVAPAEPVPTSTPRTQSEPTMMAAAPAGSAMAVPAIASTAASATASENTPDPEALGQAQEALNQFVSDQDGALPIRNEVAPFARVANFGSEDDGLRDSD
ncbi:MAG: sigma-E factor negative regulatory protein [Pseudomonadota bacterium]|nr:sigma-E factor negative regulatory protein [Pseudomonadota bacterium]